MNFIGKHILPLILFLSPTATAFAQVNFSASVNKDHVGKNEEFQLQFSLNAMGRNFQAPDLSDFYVISGPSRSQSMQIINFERSESMSISYVLRPKATGMFSINAATIVVDGTTYRSQPLTIRVSEQSPQGDDPNDPYSRAAKSAFIKIISSQTTVYQGEPFVVSYKLYFNSDIGRYEILEQPDYTGFYKEILELKNINTQLETYQGKRYNTGIIYQMVLIPQRNGSIRPGLVEMKIPTAIPTNRRDFFGRTITRMVDQISTDNFPTLRVKPLPEEGKPSGFAGAVGDYEMDVSLSRNELSANESVTLTIKISGRGNIKLVNIEEPEIPAAFEAYDPKYTERITANANGMSGSKTYEYLLIPRYGGTYKIPEIKFSYFDPQKERYETIIAEEQQITVTGGSAMPGTQGAIAGTDKENVRFIGKDILFIKTDSDNFSKIGKSFLNSTLFYVSLGTIGTAFAGMLGFFIFSTSRREDARKVRSQKASKLARKHLSQAKKELTANKQEAFYLALTSALWGYFSDKFAIPKSTLSKDVIHDTLQEKGVDADTLQRIMEIMNRAEMARFTTITTSTPKEDYEETALIITQIEKEV